MKKIILMLLVTASMAWSAVEDTRSYQHGIDFVQKTNGSYWLIYSSSVPYWEAWTHDIYYKAIDPANPPSNPESGAINLISRDEAQEPASSAMTTDGHIMITNEDGWNVTNWVSQRWGLYNEDLSPTDKAYPQMIKDGGHSGHVAAVDNYFVIHWSDDWKDDVPGADGIGVGCDVLIDIFTSTGTLIRSVDVGIDDGWDDDVHEWWPIIAGSKTQACLVWQRYVAGDQYCDLMYSLYNPSTNTFVKTRIKLAGTVKYYTYDVQYLPVIDRFIIHGTYYNGGGFAYLINASGTIVAQNTSLPDGVREMQPAMRNFGATSILVYPRYPNGAIVLAVTASSITLNTTLAGDYDWQWMGTDGIFTDDQSVYFASLSTTGIKTRTFTLPTSVLRDPMAQSVQKSFVSISPNPFTAGGEIRYTVSEPSYITVQVLDAKSQLVQTLVPQAMHQSGSYSVVFDGKNTDGTNLAAGAYTTVVSNAGEIIAVKKIMLLK